MSTDGDAQLDIPSTSPDKLPNIHHPRVVEFGATLLDAVHTAASQYLARQFKPSSGPNRDRRPAFPEQIWHYTSRRNAMEILRTGELWASRIESLNDTTEVEHFRTVAKTCYRQLSAQAPEPVGKEIRCRNKGEALSFLVRRGIESETGGNARRYVVCFTGMDDDIQHWRGYGDHTRGAAIGLKMDDLHLALESSRAWSGHRAQILPVIYEEWQKVQLSRIIVGTVLRRFRGVYTRDEAFLWPFLLRATAVLDSSIWYFGICCKHRGFRSEQEWRIMVPGEDGTTLNLSQCVGVSFRTVPTNRDIAAVELPLSMVTKVVAGPRASERSLRRELEGPFGSEARRRIGKSAIPYRSGRNAKAQVPSPSQPLTPGGKPQGRPSRGSSNRVLEVVDPEPRQVESDAPAEAFESTSARYQ